MVYWFFGVKTKISRIQLHSVSRRLVILPCHRNKNRFILEMWYYLGMPFANQKRVYNRGRFNVMSETPRKQLSGSGKIRPAKQPSCNDFCRVRIVSILILITDSSIKIVFPRRILESRRGEMSSSRLALKFVRQASLSTTENEVELSYGNIFHTFWIVFF